MHRAMRRRRTPLSRQSLRPVRKRIPSFASCIASQGEVLPPSRRRSSVDTRNRIPSGIHCRPGAHFPQRILRVDAAHYLGTRERMPEPARRNLLNISSATAHKAELQNSSSGNSSSGKTHVDMSARSRPSHLRMDAANSRSEAGAL